MTPSASRVLASLRTRHCKQLNDRFDHVVLAAMRSESPVVAINR
jgi:hypothetical protein